jgi:hypothetical protein
VELKTTLFYTPQSTRFPEDAKGKRRVLILIHFDFEVSDDLQFSPGEFRS